MPKLPGQYDSSFRGDRVKLSLR